MKGRPSLPRLIIGICRLTHSWIVGSSADPSNPNPNDIDIIVPLYEWHKVASFVPETARPNKMGGWRFHTEGVEIDIWPGDVSVLMAEGIVKFAFCPATNIRVQMIPLSEPATKPATTEPD